MWKNIKFYSMYSAFMSMTNLLIGMVFVGSASICLAQGSPWTTKTDMPTGRVALSACVVDGKIYVMGGIATGNGSGSPASPELEVYDPATDTWDTTKTDMPMGRNSFASAAVNGKIYAIGGQSVAVITAESSVIEYDPQTDTWDTTKTKMPAPRAGLSTSVVNGKIYVIGGWNFSSPKYKRDVWEYNPATDTWDTTKAPMPTPRGYLSTCVIDGKIYAFGGYNGGDAFKTVEMYDPVTDTWSTKADMPAGRIYLKTSSVDSLIYIFGGSTNPNDPPMSDVWEYNPISNKWKSVSPMPTGLVHASSGELKGKIYIIGGSETPWVFQPGSTVFEYNPHNDLLRFVENVDVDKSYAIPGVDNILITTKINDPTGISLVAKIEANQTPVDSVALFDDGNHNDGSAGDGLFATFWPVPPVEESNYNIALQVTRIDTVTVFHELNNMALFTTIGPVVHESHEITNPFGTFYSLKLSLKNKGLVATAKNVTVELTTSDTVNITNIVSPAQDGIDIGAGETGEIDKSFGIYTTGSFDFNSLTLKIFSNGYNFWTDDTVTSIENEDQIVPEIFSLEQNAPNPFNPSTMIHYQLPTISNVDISIFNLLGQIVATLVDKRQNAGTYQVEWDASRFASGVYYYQMVAGDYREVKKMILIQ